MRVRFVGDVIIDRDVDAAAARNRAREGAAAPADVLVGNLEVPLCDADAGIRATKTVAWRAPRDVAGIVRDSGFTAVSLANNHTTDWGQGGLEQTIAALTGAGVGVCGAGRSSARALERWNGVPGLAVFGLTCTTPPGSAATTSGPGLLGLRVGTRYEIDSWRSEELPGTPARMRMSYSDDELAPLLDAVRGAAARGEAVAVMVHWGAAWSARVQDYQLALAEQLVEAGTGLVVGHHSHTVAPVCRFRDGLVCLGLGDWIRSPLLVSWSDEQRPGLAADFAWHASVGLALTVEVRDGHFAGPEVEAVGIDPSTGLPSAPLERDETARLAGWLEWVAATDCRDRPGWTGGGIGFAAVTPFPLRPS